MESQSEKGVYEKYSKKINNFSPKDLEGLEAMRRSTDSLYKKLDTPNDETEEKIEESQTNETNIIKDGSTLNRATTQQTYKQNLFSKHNDCTYFSKKQITSQFGQIPNPQKLVKPSTPTFHTQSSLNFLKNRKKQIIMNQAMGLTYDNIQMLRKSRSKSRQQKSVRKSQTNKQKSSLNDFQLNAYLQKLNSLKTSTKNKSESKFQKVRSVSQLSKIESILDANKQTPNKRQFLERSRIKSPRLFSQARSLTNSLNSSRVHSNSSQSSNSSASRETRAVLINSITAKINESKFLKDIEVLKEKKIRKQTKKTQSLLEKRLSNLEKILIEFQKNDDLKRVKSDIHTKSQKKQSFGTDFIKKLKQQIENLTQQLTKLSKCTVQPNQPELNHKGRFKMPTIDQPIIQSTPKISTLNGFAPKLKNGINKNIIPSTGLLSSTPKSYQHIQTRQKSQTKITFNYNSAQNSLMISNFQSPIRHPQRQFSHSNEKHNNNLYYHSKFPSNGSINYVNSTPNQPSNSYQVTNPYQNSNNYPQIQYTNSSFTYPSHSISHHFQSQNYPTPNQLQMVPQLSYPQNKTLSLKNKHAIEAKRLSPIKVNNFNFMPLNQKKTTIH